MNEPLRNFIKLLANLAIDDYFKTERQNKLGISHSENLSARNETSDFNEFSIGTVLNPTHQSDEDINE